MSERTIMIMAGGTGGHVMPGLAVAAEMRARDWSETGQQHDRLTRLGPATFDEFCIDPPVPCREA